MRRLFVGLELPASVHEFAVDIQDQLRAVATRQGVRFVPHPKLVIPLIHLDGAGTSEETWRTMASQGDLAGPGFLELGGLGGLPDLLRPKEIFLCLACESGSILGLQGSLADRFGPEAKPELVVPRLTLARLSPGSKSVGFLAQTLADKLGTAPRVKWEPNELVIFENLASGAFEPLQRIPLLT